MHESTQTQIHKHKNHKAPEKIVKHIKDKDEVAVEDDEDSN